MRLRLYYCDHREIPLPPGHKFPIRKYRLLRRLLEAEDRFDFIPAPQATEEEIRRSHDPMYVRGFLEGTLDPRILRRIGFPWSQGLVDRTLASVGGTLQASRDALRAGMSGGLAGGTHHAFYAEGAGFCVFNDIAVAIRNLRQSREIGRSAVVDLDVHQGDGTALLFENDPGVLTLSIHGANNFPFRKQRSRIDLELQDKTADAEYLCQLDRLLPHIWDFRPDIVFFQSGVDGLATDRLGRLALTHDGLRQRDRAVLEGAKAHNIPIVITLGGGYAEPIEDTVEAHANTFRTAAAVFAS